MVNQNKIVSFNIKCQAKNVFLNDVERTVSNFHQISHGAFCRKDIANLFKRFRAIEQDGRYVYIW